MSVIEQAAGTGGLAMWGRIYAMILRHVYILRSSWPRLLDLAYWPTVQMIMWGFMSQFLAGQTSYIAQAFGVLLSAVLLWDVLFRGQLAVSISFFEEMWSRNLGHLFVTPLRPGEFAASLLSISLLRTLLGIVPASLLAVAFFGFSVYSLGLSLAAFFFSLLMFGWAIGLAVTGLVLRHGLGAENIAWGLVFALLPVSAVYYPVSVLPEWLQWVAYAMPAAYSFEGMRSILLHNEVRLDLMAAGFALNIVYLGLGVALFFHYFRVARRRGSLLQQGE
ncbi:MAG: ABC transporter permease [Reyranellaceae bacterium]